MSIFDQLPKEDNDQPKPDEEKKPSFEPKRIVHRSKPAAQAGDGNRQRASIFGRRATRRKTQDQTETPAVAQPTGWAVNAKPEEPAPRKEEDNNPGLRLRTLLTSGKEIPPSKPPRRSRPFIKGEQARRAYWDVAAGLSLIVNAVLVAILLLMAFQIRSLKTTLNGLLSGLYNNFVGMDNATITSNITVDAQIPINFMLPIQQNTDVQLTSSVVIKGANVVINSGGLSINAAATVTLPAGTNLPIALNLSVPVVATIPVTLQVPVNIPLNQTQLHNPFAGLQDTIRPLYCTLDKNAQYPQGIYICKNHDIPASAPITP